MAVAGLETESVVDDDEIAVGALVSRLRDDAGGGGVNRLTLLAGDIETGVEVGAAGDRIRPRAHARREPAMGRPDRRRRIGQGISLLDHGAHGLQTGLESFEQRAEQAERVFRLGERRERLRVGRVLLLDVSAGVTLPPIARVFTNAGSFSIARARPDRERLARRGQRWRTAAIRSGRRALRSRFGSWRFRLESWLLA